MHSMNKASVLLRATVVGLTGKQANALLQEVGTQFDLHILTPERALRLWDNRSDVVIMTRFIGHKHERHIRRVSNCRVIVLHSGGARAVANALRSLAITLPKAA